MADSSGNSNTGNIVGGVATGQPGGILGDSAIATNGIDGFVTSTTPVTPTAAFSNSVWFNTTTDRGGAIMGFSDAQTGTGLRDNRALYMENDGRVVFGIRRGNVGNPGQSFVRGPGFYNDGNWHHATTVYNGTNNITLYMDGKQVATLNITQPVVPGPGFLRVGYMDLARFYTVFGQNYDQKPHVMSYFWQGRVDEASMHNTALTAAQVAALYAVGLGLRCGAPAGAAGPGRPAAATGTERVPGRGDGRHALDVLEAQRAWPAAHRRLLRPEPDRHVPRRAQLRSCRCADRHDHRGPEPGHQRRWLQQPAGHQPAGVLARGVRQDELQRGQDPRPGERPDRLRHDV